MNWIDCEAWPSGYMAVFLPYGKGRTIIFMFANSKLLLSRTFEVKFLP